MGGQQFLAGGALLDMRRLIRRALVSMRPGPDGGRGRHHLARRHPRLPRACNAAPDRRFGHPPEADRRRPPHDRWRRRRQHSRPRPRPPQPFIADLESLEVVTRRGRCRHAAAAPSIPTVPARGRRIRAVRRGHRSHAAAGAAPQGGARGGAARHRRPHRVRSTSASPKATCTATFSSPPRPSSPDSCAPACCRAIARRAPTGRCRASSGACRRPTGTSC